MAFPPSHSHADTIEESEVGIVHRMKDPIAHTLFIPMDLHNACRPGDVGILYRPDESGEKRLDVLDDGIGIDKDQNAAPCCACARVPPLRYILPQAGGISEKYRLFAFGNAQCPVGAAAVADDDLEGIERAQGGSELGESTAQKFLLIEGRDDDTDVRIRIQ